MKHFQHFPSLCGGVRKPMRTGIPAALGALALALASLPFAHADVNLEDEEFASKAIRVDAPENELLRVQMKPLKEAFKVGEPIGFTVRGNKEFFLYLFSVDRDTEEATLILPSKQGQEHNKYPAGMEYPVPNPDAPAFLADAEGVETLVMVASTKYLPLKSNWFRRGADSYVASAKEFEAELADKAIRVGRERTRNAKVFVSEVSIRVVDEATAERDAVDVWLTTKGNRTEYGVGEAIEAVFGAEQDGWVHLHVVNANGDREKLKSYEVEKGAAYVMKARAERPTGEHAFLATFTADREDRLGAASALAVKGVSLVDDTPDSTAVYRFLISSDI